MEVNGSLDTFIVHNEQGNIVGGVINDTSFYTINENNEVIKIKVEISGELYFKADDTVGAVIDDNGDLIPGTEIDLSRVIQTILTNTEIGVVLKNAGFEDKKLGFTLKASVNIMDLILNGTEAMERMEVVFIIDAYEGSTITATIAVYIERGNLYADFADINLGKLRIDNVMDFLGDLSGGLGGLMGGSQTAGQVNAPRSSAYSMAERGAMARISLQLGNNHGLVVAICSDVIAVMLNAFAIPQLENEKLGDLFNEITYNSFRLQIDVAHSAMAGLKLNLGQYEVGVQLNEVTLHFRRTEMSELARPVRDRDTGEILIAGFEPNDYLPLSLSAIHISVSAFFGWEMDDGTDFNLAEALQGLDIMGLKIEPILKIIGALGAKFRLDVDLNLNLADLMNDAIPFEQRFKSSSMRIQMHEVSTGEAMYVLAIHYVNGDLYIDLEAFGIQKVLIEDAVDYFISFYYNLTGTPTGNTAVPMYSASGARNMPNVNAVASYINLIFCPEGIVLNVGSAALFAVLRMMSLDIESYIDPVGYIDINATLFGAEDVFELEFALYSKQLNCSEAHTHGALCNNAVKLFLSFSNSYEISFGILDRHIITPPSGYHRIETSAPTLGIGTKIVFEAFASEDGEILNLYREPLESLVANLLSDMEFITEDFLSFIQSIAITIYFGVVQETHAVFEMDILINLNVLDPSGINLQITMFVVSTDAITKQETRTRIMQFNTYFENLYIDLSPIGGPMFYVEEFVPMVLGGLDGLLGNLFGGDEDGADPSAPNNAPKNEPSTPYGIRMPLELQINETGLFAYAYKEAFNAILTMLKMEELAMFDKITLDLHAIPENNALTLGLGISIRDTGRDVDDISIGFDLKGWRVNFEPWGENTLIIPNPDKYEIGLSEVQTIKLSLQFEVGFSLDEGNIMLEALYEVLLNPQLTGLTSTLPYALSLGNLGDTLVVDLDAIVEIDDFANLLNTVQLRISVYSKSDPHSFRMDIYYHRGNLYVDGRFIGLTQVKVDDFMGFIEFFGNMFAGGGEEDEELSNSASLASKVLALESKMKNAPANTPAYQSAFDQAIHRMYMIEILLGAETGLLVQMGAKMFELALLALGLELDPMSMLAGIVAGLDDIPDDDREEYIKEYLQNLGINTDIIQVSELLLKIANPELNLRVTPDLNASIGFKLTGFVMHDCRKNNICAGTLCTEYGVVEADGGSLGMHLGINLPATRLSFFRKKTHSSAPPADLISQAEIAQYTNYSELSVYTEINMSATLELHDGRITADGLIGAAFQILGLPGALETDIVFAGGYEQMIIEINGRLGIDFKKLMDPTLPQNVRQNALVASLEISYHIIDQHGKDKSDSYYSHTLASAYFIDNNVYLSIKLFDSVVDVVLPDIDIATWMFEFFGIAKSEEDGDGNPISGYGSPQSLQNASKSPLHAMGEGFKAVGAGVNNFDTISSVIMLNSSGLTILLTQNLLVDVLEFLRSVMRASQSATGEAMLDLEGVDFRAILDEVLTSASLGVVFNEKDGFAVKFNLFKDQETRSFGNSMYQSAGYDITLSLLHNTAFSTHRSDYDSFYHFLTVGNIAVDPEHPDYFNMVEYKLGCFDITDVAWRITMQVEFFLGADFRAFLLNWSGLVSAIDPTSAFYIQFLERMSGDVILRLHLSTLFTEIGRFALDLILEFVDGDGNEIMTLFFVGNLDRTGNNPNYDYNNIDPKLYLRLAGVPDQDIEPIGIALDADSFMHFANLNLRDFFDAFKVDENGASPASLQFQPDPDNDDEGDAVAAWWATLLESVVFNKGQIVIVVAKTALQTIASELLGLPFDEIGRVSLTIDMIAGVIQIDLSLDNQRDVETSDLYSGGISYSTFGGNHWIDKDYMNDPSLVQPMQDAVNLTIASFNTQRNGLPAHIVLAEMTANRYNIWNQSFASAVGFTKATEERFYNGRIVIITHIENEALGMRGAHMRLSNGLVVMLFQEETEFPSNISRRITINELDVGILAVSEITYARPEQFIPQLIDPAFPAFDPGIGGWEFITSFASEYTKKYDDNATTMKDVYYFLYGGVTFEMISEYVKLLERADYYWMRDHAGVWHLEKNKTVFQANCAVCAGCLNYEACLSPIIVSGKGESINVLIKLIWNEASGVLQMAVYDNSSMFNFKFGMASINVKLAVQDIFRAYVPYAYKDDFTQYFDYYFSPFNSFKWEFETGIEFTADDTIGGFFDATSLIGMVVGMVPALSAFGLEDIAFGIQPGEALSVRIGLTLRMFIDFKDLEKLNLQLRMTYQGNEVMLITYQGRINSQNEEESTLFVDLTGLFTQNPDATSHAVAFKIEDVMLAGLVKGMMGSINLSGIGSSLSDMIGGIVGGIGADSNNSANNGARSASQNSARGEYLPLEDIIDLSQITFGNALLLLTMASNNVTLAITGAMVVSAMQFLSGGDMSLPMFNNLEIGYAENVMERTYYSEITERDSTTTHNTEKLKAVATRKADSSAVLVLAKRANNIWLNAERLELSNITEQLTYRGRVWGSVAGLYDLWIGAPDFVRQVTAIYSYPADAGCAGCSDCTVYHIVFRAITDATWENYLKSLETAFVVESKVEGRDLAGLMLRLTNDTPYEQAFRLGLNFRGGYFGFGTGITNRITVADVERYEDISSLKEIGLTLDAELTIRTRTPENEKSEQIQMLEQLIEIMLGMAPGAIDLDLQDSTVIFGLSLRLYSNIGPITYPDGTAYKQYEATTLQLIITFNDSPLFVIYYYATSNTVYIDLDGLGLFRSAINGVDLMAILGGMLSGFVGENGIDLTSLLMGGGGEEDSEESGSGTQNPASPKNSALNQELLTAQDSALVRVLFTNEGFTINPNAMSLAKLVTGIMPDIGPLLPAFPDIRISTSVASGLNNLSARIRVDNLGNRVQIDVAEDGFLFAVGGASRRFRVPELSESRLNTFGGIVGATLTANNQGAMVMDIDTVALLSTIVDTIMVRNLTIYLDHRADYWYLRNLRFDIPKYINGPTYFGTDMFAGYQKADQPFGLYPFANVDLGWLENIPLLGGLAGPLKNLGIGLDSYSPMLIKNGYRRIRLQVTKTPNNAIEARIEQLTAVLGIDNLIPSPEEDWIPMRASAFISDNIVRLRLGTALVLDISGIIEWLGGIIVRAVGGIFGPLGSTISGLAWSAFGPYISQWLAGLVGDISGYGNPLALGQIIDDITGGGIEVFRMFMPDLLKPDSDESQYDYGTLYGMVTGRDGAPIQGARVTIYTAGALITSGAGYSGGGSVYTTLTDKDGYYAFINVGADEYIIQISKIGYADLTMAGDGELDEKVNVRPFTTHPAMRSDYILRQESEMEIFTDITIVVRVQSSAGSGTVPNVPVYLDNGITPLGSTDSSGLLIRMIGTLSEGVYKIAGSRHFIRLGNGQREEFTITSADNGRQIQINIVYANPGSGIIAGRLMTYNRESLLNGTAGLSELQRVRAGASMLVGAWNNELTAMGITGEQGIVWGSIPATREYYKDSQGVIYAVIPNTTKAQLDSANTATAMGGRYNARTSNHVTGGINYRNGIIYESRYFPQSQVAVMAFKRAELVSINPADVEIWLTINGNLSSGNNLNSSTKTIMQSHSHNGLSNRFCVSNCENACANPQDQNWCQKGEGDRIEATVIPRNYLVYGERNGLFEEAPNVDGNGYFEIRDLALNTNYMLKIRSRIYKNQDGVRPWVATNINILATEAYRLAGGDGIIILEPRPPHWTEQEESDGGMLSAVGNMISSVRIRLGADILDKGYNSNDIGIPRTTYDYLNSLGKDVLGTLMNTIPGILEAILPNVPFLGTVTGWLTGWGSGQLGTGDKSAYLDEKNMPTFVPWSHYITGYKKGAQDRYDGVTYIEIWLNPTFITGMFDMVHGMLFPMMGMEPISQDQRWTQGSTSRVPDGVTGTGGFLGISRDQNIDNFKYNGAFNELNDLVVNHPNGALFNYREEAYSGNRSETRALGMIYDYVYPTKEAYTMNMRASSASIPGGVVSFAINMAFDMIPDFFQNDFLRMVIQYAAGAFLDEQLDMVSRLISHLVPFVYPYSMMEERHFENSPLMQNSVSSTTSESVKTNVAQVLRNEGIVPNGQPDLAGNIVVNPAPNTANPHLGHISDSNELLNGTYREVDFHDRSVYAKVTLNTDSNAMFERLNLFINGASYKFNENERGNKTLPGETLATYTPYIIGENMYAPNATIMRADTIRYEVNSEGISVPIASHRVAHNAINKWIRSNVVNSFVIVKDYQYSTDENMNTTRRLIAVTYIRDVYGHFDAEEGFTDWEFSVATFTRAENQGGRGLTVQDAELAMSLYSAKDDFFYEIDFHNSGIRLRHVLPVPAGGGGFKLVKDSGGGPIWDGDESKPMTMPSKIIFNDPYNPRDFTAIGGTWAGALGARHNLDENGVYSEDSVTDILPNRFMANFRDGDASDSSGVQIYWDFSLVDFTPTREAKQSFIVGRVANQIAGVNSMGELSIIHAEVLGGMVVNPSSTLNLNADGSAVDTNNTKQAIKLDDIDPLKFDLAQYIKNLPSSFDYTYAMVYEVNGNKQQINGSDVLYRRYIFNDLKWDLSQTDFNYEGRESYARLTYSFIRSSDYGHEPTPVTINVPIRFINREIKGITAPIPSGNGLNIMLEEGFDGLGNPIIRSVMEFNPLQHNDPRGSIERLLGLNVDVLWGNGQTSPWQVLGINANAFSNYDSSRHEMQEIPVYFLFEDELGLTQRVEITVRILSKTIDQGLTDIGYGELYPDPMYNRVKDIYPFANNGLELPTSFEAVYTSGLSETLFEGADFEWDTEDISALTYRFSGTESLLPFKIFPIKAIIGGSSQSRQVITVYARVFQMIPRITANPIVINPYGNGEVPNTLNLDFSNVGGMHGAGNFFSKPISNVYYLFNDSRAHIDYDTRVIGGISYKHNIVFNNMSFAGEDYQTDILLYDEVFGRFTIRNVPLHIRATEISGMELPASVKVNQYFAKTDIDSLLAHEDVKLVVSLESSAGATPDKVSRAFFDIIGWEYFHGHDGGLASNPHAVPLSSWITVTVRFKSTGRTQTFNVDLLSHLNNLSVRGLKTESESINNPFITQGTGGSFVYTVNDPRNFTFPDLLEVWFEDNAVNGNAEVSKLVPVTFDLRTQRDDFFKLPSIEGTIRTGTHALNYKEFNVIFVNQSVRTVQSVEFLSGSNPYNPDTLYGFDEVPLPTHARVNFAGGSSLTFDNLSYLNINAPSANGGTFTATVLIGDNVFGYIEAPLSVTVLPETIVEWRIGNFNEVNGEIKNVNPYLNVREQLENEISPSLTVYTSRGRVLTLNTKYPDIPLSYLQETTHRVSFEIGRTFTVNNFGYPRGTQTAYEYDARETFIINVTVEARVAEGIEFIDSFGEAHSVFVGNVYNKIDFPSQITVVFRGTEPMVLDVVWDTSRVFYSFIGGNYSVRAHIGEVGTANYQWFDVPVRIMPSYLIAIELEGGFNSDIFVLDNDGKGIKGLLVDPLVGFKGLPETVGAVLNDNTGKAYSALVEWHYSRIRDRVSMNGVALSEELMLVAEIYVLEEVNGFMIRSARQFIEIPVEVIDRTVVEIVATFKQGDLAPIALYRDGDVVNSFTLNPYQRAYSEMFDSPDFAYFGKITLTVKDGAGTKQVEVMLNQASQRATDTRTNSLVSQNNLYSGRDILLRLSFNAGETDSASRGAEFNMQLSVTILDMSYASGLAKDAYFVDIYGIVNQIFMNGEMREVTANWQFVNENRTITGASGETHLVSVTYNESDVLWTLDSRGNRDREIKSGSGTGYLRVSIGNQFGGYEQVLVPVHFIDREVVSLFNPETTPYFGQFRTSPTSPITVQGFIFDPFEAYDISVYPQKGTISFANQIVEWGMVGGTLGAYGFTIEWNDSSVARVVSGGSDSTVTAHITSVSTGISQRVSFRVKFLNRTVVGYDELLKSDTLLEHFFIEPYKYLNVNDISRAIADDIFKSAGSSFNVRFTEGPDIRFTFGGKASNFTVDPNNTWDWNNSLNDMSYYVTQAKNQHGAWEWQGAENQLRRLVTLSEAEIDLDITFTLDQTRPLSFKGNNVRFFVSIPGFGLGRNGRQFASCEVQSYEAYIMDVLCWDETTHSYVDYYTWLTNNTEGLIGSFGNYITKVPGKDYSFDISNPYAFIMQGGAKMPEKVQLITGTENGQRVMDASGQAVNCIYSDIEVFWTGSRGGSATIYFNRSLVRTSFQIEMDNQSFSFEFHVIPWVLEATTLFNESSTYSVNQVVLLPNQQAVSSDYRTDNPNRRGVLSVTNGEETDTYTLQFPNGQSHTFSNVTGGGSYINDFAKWSFDDVNFYSNRAQYATMTLGGRGGQQIYWYFGVSTHELVNETMPKTITLATGAGVAQSYTLPSAYRQLMANQYSYDNNRLIPISYTGGSPRLRPSDRNQPDSKGEFFSNNPNPRPNVTLSGYTVTAQSNNTYNGGGANPFYSFITPATPHPDPKRNMSSQNTSDHNGITTASGAPMFVEWRATSHRAYPASYEEVGGEVWFITYKLPEVQYPSSIPTEAFNGALVNTLTQDGGGAFLIHPSSLYVYSEFRARIDGHFYSYEGTLAQSMEGALMNDDDPREGYQIPQMGMARPHLVSEGNSTEIHSQVPILTINQGSQFNTLNLPQIALRWNRLATSHNCGTISIGGCSGCGAWIANNWNMAPLVYDLVYTVPWERATVYRGTQISPGNMLAGGVTAINTGIPNTQFLIVAPMIFAGNRQMNVAVQINIKNYTERPPNYWV